MADLRYRRIVLEFGRGIDDHRLAGLTPACTWRESPNVPPSVTVRRCALCSFMTKMTFSSPRLTQRLVGHQHAARPRLIPLGGFFLFEERNAHTHVRDDAIILDVDPDAHLHRRLGAIGRGNYGDHMRGNLPIRIGIQHRIDRLAWAARG